ncbi:uncharacterized protein [Eucyclogobius newberryi]|uniref:uncharacterized protein n=1 Tax=Eucyclogobius newberryi TaxID=166745 RepID=UPI003B5CB580
MKAVCTVLCLGLLSVCGAAPLTTCDQLITTGDRGVDFSGRWYLHALSTDSCVLSSVWHTFLKPSLALDVVYQETQKSYEVVTTIKIQTACENDTRSYIFDNTSFTLSHEEESYHLLPSDCTDCIIWKIESFYKAIFLYSRKTTIDPADLKEFETRAACLGLPKPRVVDTDYDFGHCKDFEEEEHGIFLQRMKDSVVEMIECVVKYVSNL